MKREPFRRLRLGRRVQLYVDLADWWVGVFFGPDATYYCVLTLVVKVTK